jgi:outer membrane protein assembly factor BamB
MPLAASLLTIALARGAEPVVATPFDIRHDASELLDDLKARRGEPGALLERVQNLVAQHGDRMITDGDLCAPLAELFAIRLAEMGLAETFARTYDGTAERRFRDAVRTRAGEAELRALALSYPGTMAATRAWRHLADQAWDSGRLGQYLDYARRAGESSDKQRGQRVAAANALLTPDHSFDLPESLDGLEEMWRIDLSEAIEAASSPTEPMRDQRFRRIRRQVNVAARFTLASAPGELTAASDGQKFFLYDHLIGRLVGEVRTLGNVPLGQFKSRPAVTRTGFIGLGWVEDHAVLMSLDRLGEVKWRWNSPSLGPIEAVSAPVVLDNLVVFSALVLGNQEGAELRALAFRVDTGRPVWNTLIARIPLPRQQMIFASNDIGLSSPALAVHGGSLVVLSNNGLIARLGIDGNVNRLWNYPSMGDEFDNGFGGGTAPTRQGAIVSDGTFLVASPSDSPGAILYLGPNDHAPRRFQGDGANGEALDVVRGLALLAGPRNLALFDIAAGRVRWAIPFSGRDGVQGRIGKGRVLLSTNEQLALIDSTSGRITGSRGLAKGVSLAITADLVMAASNERVIGWGRGASFLERLTKAAAADPADFRPWGTLASFHESRDDREKAFSCLVEALIRGAPVEYAERAARLVRGQLELGAGDVKAFPAPLAKLQSLTVHDDRLKGEIALWRGRHAELLGDAATAIASFQAATTFPDHRMLLKDRLEARVHILARNGLVRLKAIPETAAPGISRRPLPKPASAWSAPGRRGDTLLVAGDMAVGFSDGFLAATKVADGSVAWRRQPVRQLLGVRTTLNPNLDNTEGIPIQEVVPGSSADGAGMRNGDVLMAFQGRKTTNFDRDLRAVVATMAPRTPFTMTVLRNGVEVELKGLLGGEPVEPLAANDHTLLLWLTTPLGAGVQPGRPQSVPEGMWFAAVDLATGTELFRHALRPTNETGEPPPQPLLTANDLVLTQDGSELVCLQAHGGKAGEAPAPLWRMPLGDEGMDRVRVLSSDLLWLPEVGRNRVHLIDLMTGTTRFVLPEDLAADPILVGTTCFCLGREGRITCWDLDLGRQRWRTAKVYGRLHAMSGDGLYATDENNQLVVLDAFSGEVRRRFGEWAAIESTIAGTDALAVFVRRPDRSQALARISLAGGHVQWEQVLPHGVEVGQLIDAPDAFGAQLFEGGDRRMVTVMMVGKNGAIRSAQSLAADEKVVPVEGGLLAYSPAGLRVLPNVLPNTPPGIPCGEVQADGDLTSVANAALPRLAWQTVGSGSYAVARHRGGLLLFARLGADLKPLGLRLGDGDQAIDGTGLMAIFSATNPQFIGTGAWVVDGAKRLSADGEQPLLVLRLQAAPDRIPGTTLSLRAECGEVSDAANAPWWLRRAWRPVTGGP